MLGVRVHESVGNDGLRVAMVSGPEYVSCEVIPAPGESGAYLRQVRRRGGGYLRRYWYPSYEEALAAALNYAGADLRAG